MAHGFKDQELMLLDVKFQNYRVGDGIDAYYSNDILYLPLLATLELLELPYTTEAGAITARHKGAILFSVVQQQSLWVVTQHSKTDRLPPNSIIEDSGMLYIDAALLSTLVPVRFELNFSDQYVELFTSQPLPFAERLDRHNRTIVQRSDHSIQYPLKPAPYRFFETPSIDLRYNYAISRDLEQETQSIRDSYATTMRGDMFWMNGSLYLSGDRDNGLRSARLTLEHRDPDNRLLGPLQASTIKLGDLGVPSMPLAPQGSGRGVSITNDLIMSQRQYDKVDIEGDLYPEWEVELRHNGLLIEFMQTSSNERYSFLDIPLYMGRNSFEITLYGPNGEIEKRVEEHNITPTSRPGTLSYNFTFIEGNRTMIKLDDSTEEREPHYRAILQYPINRFLSLNGGFNRATIESETSNTLNLGLSLFLKEFKIDYIEATNRQDWQKKLSINTRIGDVNLRLAHQQDAAANDETPSRLVESRNNSIGLDGNALKIRYNLSISQSSSEQSETLNTQLNLSRGFGWAAINQKLSQEQIEDRITYQKQSSADGTTSMQISWERLSLNLSFGYSLQPTSELNSIGVEINSPLANNINFNSSASYSPTTKIRSSSAGITWQLPQVAITPRISYSGDGRYAGFIYLSTSLAKRETAQGTALSLANKNRSTAGTIRARLFHDRNQNQIFDEGDSPVADGQIMADQARRSAITNKDGLAWMSNVSTWKPTDIVVNDGSFDDPSLIMGGANFSVIPRPGTEIQIDIPLIKSGEIAGTVLRQQNSREGSAPERGVLVQLINLEGEIVKSTQTIYDGSYLFELIPPGEYTVQVQNRGQKIASPSLQIGGKGEVYDSVDLVIPLESTPEETIPTLQLN